MSCSARVRIATRRAALERPRLMAKAYERRCPSRAPSRARGPAQRVLTGAAQRAGSMSSSPTGALRRVAAMGAPAQPRSPGWPPSHDAPWLLDSGRRRGSREFHTGSAPQGGMDKSGHNEAEICQNFISPALVRAGWEAATQVRREFTFTAARFRGHQLRTACPGAGSYAFGDSPHGVYRSMYLYQVLRASNGCEGASSRAAAPRRRATPRTRERPRARRPECRSAR